MIITVGATFTKSQCVQNSSYYKKKEIKHEKKHNQTKCKHNAEIIDWDTNEH